MKNIRLNIAIALTLAIANGSTLAYSCGGLVTYLGISAEGEVTTAVQGTPIHRICALVNQGTYQINPLTCKAVYASLLVARSTGKSATIFYGDNGSTCTTLPAWQPVSNVYFLESPW